LYPALEIHISPEEGLTKVNEFEVNEISCSLGHVKDSDGEEVKSEMSLWYLSDKDKKPVIVELDFDCKAIELSDETALERFPDSMNKSINHLYALLQGESIVDQSMSKTKTEFAYNSHKRM
jgi:hypothetical protein